MKKEERILNALSEVKDEYVEECSLEDGVTPPKRYYWGRWVGMAASIVLLILIGSNVPRELWYEDPVDIPIPSTENKNTEEQDITIIDVMKDAGFSIVTSSNDLIEIDRRKQLITQNPWNTEMQSLRYPVYKNLAYMSPAGASAYLSEVELLGMAEDVATKLGTILTEWEYFYVQEDGVDTAGKPYQITAKSDLAEIGILGNGATTIIFNESIQIPEDYLLTDDKDIDRAEAAVYYLIEKYSTLFGANNIKADCGVTYDLIGNREISFSAFGQTEKGNAVTEYCFNQIYFYADEDGNLRLIRFGDIRKAADYMGDYAIITVEEARTRLDEGNYFSILTEEDAIGGTFSDENIAKVELTYLTGSACQYFQPYYCFYVEIEADNTSQVNYCTYFVPALTATYLATFPEINPIGN